ncbi:hypothetical protein WJX73_004988 [Symbiochloris irregularis]|uniref:Uncharacterized protein n=1 Tax=Symbiochloris irregularis TaxID=706552 RepID=A0AAW1NTC3_9CHLO
MQLQALVSLSAPLKIISSAPRAQPLTDDTSYRCSDTVLLLRGCLKAVRPQIHHATLPKARAKSPRRQSKDRHCCGTGRSVYCALAPERSGPEEGELDTDKARGMDESGPASGPKSQQRENTYILDPAGYGENAVFRRHKVLAVIQNALQEKVAGQQYDPVKGAQHAKQFADHVREKVKALGAERHKIIVQVTLAQKKGQASRIASRCLWDAATDTCASATYENEHILCTCQVYGLYFE